VFSNSVLRGDTVVVSAIAECPPELDMTIRVSKLHLTVSEPALELFTIKGSGDILLASTSDLAPGELLAGSSCVVCSTSCADDRILMNGLRANRSGIVGSVLVELMLAGASPTPPSLDSLGILSPEALADLTDATVTAGRAATMCFYMPPLQLVDSPFQCEVALPPSALAGVEFTISIRVTNKLSTVERIQFKVDHSPCFLINSAVAVVVEVRCAFIQYCIYCIFVNSCFLSRLYRWDRIHLSSA
jgi:hypothetical protein